MAIIKASHYKNQYIAKSKVKYILEDKSRANHLIDHNTLLLNFTEEADPKKLHRQFLKQALLLKPRKNGAKMYHFIISFSPLDNPSSEELMQVMRKFVELRGLSNNLVLGKSHVSEKHKHCHILASANPIRGMKPIRYNKTQFRKMKIELEKFQLERYPKTMSHSIVHLNAKERTPKKYLTDKTRRAEREFQLRSRLGKGVLTKKDRAKQTVESLFSLSASQEDLIQRIKAHQRLQVYSYRSVVKGILFEGRKYRFKSLEISPEKLRKLHQVEERLRQLSLVKEMARSKERGQGRGR